MISRSLRSVRTFRNPGDFGRSGAPGPAPLLRPQPDPRPSFASYGLIGDLADWGWVYQTENNGKWINASTGNLGDITG